MIVELLKMLQVISNMKQYDLAEAMDVHPAYLSTALKSGKVTDALLRKIARMLRVSPNLVIFAAMTPPYEFPPNIIPAFTEMQNHAKRLILKAAGEIAWQKKKP